DDSGWQGPAGHLLHPVEQRGMRIECSGDGEREDAKGANDAKEDEGKSNDPPIFSSLRVLRLIRVFAFSSGSHQGDRREQRLRTLLLAAVVLIAAALLIRYDRRALRPGYSSGPDFPGTGPACDAPAPYPHRVPTQRVDGSRPRVLPRLPSTAAPGRARCPPRA